MTDQTFEERDQAVARFTGGVLAPLSRADYEAIVTAAGIAPHADAELLVADVYTELPPEAWRFIPLAEHVRLIADYRRALALGDEAGRTPTWHALQWQRRDRDRERLQDWLSEHLGYGPRKHCRRCGESGFAGLPPFTTIADGDVCDDCL